MTVAIFAQWFCSLPPTLLLGLYNSQLVHDCLIDAAASGFVPCGIFGDCKCQLDQLICLPALLVSDWADRGSDPTCATANSRVSRRMDLLLTNRLLQCRAHRSWVDCSLGLETYAIQFLSLVEQYGPAYLV